MAKLTFYKNLPSAETFKAIPDVAAFARRQHQKWEEFISPIRVQSNDHFPGAFVADQWNQLAGLIEQGSFDPVSGWPGLEERALSHPLIPFDSELGITMREIADTLGSEAFNGAMRAVAGEHYRSSGREMGSQQLLGFFQIATMFPPMARSPEGPATKGFRARLKALDAASSSQLEQIGALEEEARQELESLRAQHTSQGADYEEWRTRANEQITTLYQEWGDEWVKLRTALVEDLRVKAPVVFWNEQAASHGAKANRWGIGSIILGAIGFLGVFWASKAVVEWIIQAEAFAARPSVQLFSMIAAVGLISSMYLWLMRVTVRFYISEMHLATDASGRAALTTTYLALLKEDAVKPEDRAIVLTALFRPPQDGMVKDDGLPTISTGALLSGALSKPGPG